MTKTSSQPKKTELADIRKAAILCAIALLIFIFDLIRYKNSSETCPSEGLGGISYAVFGLSSLYLACVGTMLLSARLLIKFKHRRAISITLGVLALLIVAAALLYGYLAAYFCIPF